MHDQNAVSRERGRDPSQVFSRDAGAFLVSCEALDPEGPSKGALRQTWILTTFSEGSLWCLTYRGFQTDVKIGPHA